MSSSSWYYCDTLVSCHFLTVCCWPHVCPQPDDGKVAVKVYGATWVPWRSRGAVFKVTSALTLATMKALREMGVSFEHVPIPVRMLTN